MEESYIKEVGEYYPVKEMEAWVHMGFYSLHDLLDIWVSEILYPDQFWDDQKKEVEGIFKELINELEVEMEEWPEVTDVDRLNEVFRKLMDQGVVCTHHVGLEPWMDWGVDSQEYIRHPEKEKVFGCCYYWFIDMMGAISSDELFLRYDSMNACGDEGRMREVGKMVQTALESEGFEVEWSGSHEDAILIKDFVWQRW